MESLCYSANKGTDDDYDVSTSLTLLLELTCPGADAAVIGWDTLRDVLHARGLRIWLSGSTVRDSRCRGGAQISAVARKNVS